MFFRTGSIQSIQTRTEPFFKRIRECEVGSIGEDSVAADGAPKDGRVTVREINEYRENVIPELTGKFCGQAQYPNSFSSGQDLPLSVVEGN